jgi:uncharacterized membrane protein YsdA (DUF1294 family)
MMKSVLRLIGAAIILGFVAFAVSLGRAPLNLLWIYLIIGSISFFNYWRDKRAAEAGKLRVRENVLHLSDLVFGIVGGLIAQVVLRHKISKPNFAMVTGLITALHVVALALLITGYVDYPGLR